MAAAGASAGATAAPGPSPPHPSLAPRWTPEQVRAMVARLRHLERIADPASPGPNPECVALRQALLTLRHVAQARAHDAAASAQGLRLGAAAAAAGDTSPAPISEAHPAAPGTADGTSGGFPHLLAPEQVRIVQTQLQAYKLLVRGVPLPTQIQSALAAPTATLSKLNGQLPDLAHLGARGNVAQAAAESHLAARLAHTIEKQDTSLIAVQADGKPKQVDANTLTRVSAPAAAYPHDRRALPFTYLATPTPLPQDAAADAVSQALVMPSLLPAGLDPSVLLSERDACVQARIERRVAELEALPSVITSGPSSSFVSPWLQGGGDATAQTQASNKVRALIELKGLQLLAKQRQMRVEVAQSMDQAASMVNDRSAFRKFRKQTLREARMTESLERKQRAEDEKKAKAKHTSYLSSIHHHGANLLSAHRSAQSAHTRLTRNMLKLHGDVERDEARRVERIAKERLQALRADDEEAYLKLIDTAKDTRIAHLLGQTDKYLDNLAHAVQVQQSDEVHQQIGADGVDESAFGASRLSEDDEDAEAAEKVDYYGTAHRIRETVTEQPSILTGGELKDYQLKGLQWMVSLYNNHLNGILADEMGLGKTIQTISLITYLIEKKRQPSPYLVIVPLSTLPNWVNEFHKWAPSVSVLVYKGQPLQRKELAVRVRQGNWQVLLTTYEFIIKDKSVLSKVKWIHMIMDEGHRMKNASSKLAVTLTQFYTSRYRLLLTGTPLQNNLPELWALLNFVLPKIFDSVKSFDEWFNTPFANAGGGDTSMQLNEEEQLLIIKRLHKVLRPFLLRRLKKDVESELPDKVEKVIKCAKSALQSKLYTQMSKHKTLFTGSELAPRAGMGGGLRGLQNMLMQLRKICQHPYVFEEVEAAINPTKATGSDLYRVSGKFELLDRILPKLRATGHRVLMFFQMTQIMDIMEDFLRYRGLTYLRLDGSTKQDERGAMLAEFNKPDSPYFMFILSTRAGGLGLNLQTADTVIIFDSDFNPHQDLQAQDRAHRIGQKMEVRIFRLVTEKSVEEKILEIAHRKLDMDSKVIQAGRFHESATNEERDTLLRAMLEAGDEEEGEGEDEMSDETINALLARSSSEELRFAEMDVEREQTDQAEWTARGGTGLHPPRLISEEELPSHFQQAFEDEYTASLEAAKEGSLGDELAPRRRAAAAAVRYDDNLTESQFLAAIENEQDPVVVAEAKRAREVHGRVRKDRVGAVSGSPDPGLLRAESSSPFSTPPSRSAKRKRASPEALLGVPAGVPNTKKRKSDVGRSERDLIGRGLAQCYAALLESKDETGRSRSAMFIDLPSAKLYPDYRVLIREPICMRQIKRRIDSRVYKDLAAATRDLHLMVRNAQTYNQEGSWVWEDARRLQDAWDTAWRHMVQQPPFNNLPGADGRSPTPASTRAPAGADKARSASVSVSASVSDSRSASRAASPPQALALASASASTSASPGASVAGTPGSAAATANAPDARAGSGSGVAPAPAPGSGTGSSGTGSSGTGSGFKLRLSLGGRKVTLSRKT